ncbi:hypothetical protein IKF02_03530 [Candidatus Saccharibacteria bacterium]|nr:hypothetical protein [Candidatus Saccharibacteria bacterium]
MKEKNFSKAEVIEAILANNTSRVVEMLEEFDLPKDDTPPPFHFWAKRARICDAKFCLN